MDWRSALGSINDAEMGLAILGMAIVMALASIPGIWIRLAKPHKGRFLIVFAVIYGVGWGFGARCALALGGGFLVGAAGNWAVRRRGHGKSP